MVKYIVRFIRVLWGILLIGMMAAALFPESSQASTLKYIYQKGLKKSKNRADYPSDKVFANHRSIHMGSIRDKWLYRSVSPYYYSNKRGAYADSLMKKAKIKTVINLQRGPVRGNIIKRKSPYYYKLWKKGKVKQLYANLKLEDAAFKKKVASGLVFMSKNKGPYLIHCVSGRDRTGYFCALLECFMGASYDDIVKDYMKTYKNLYVNLDNAAYRRIKQETIVPILKEITGSDYPWKVNLRYRASKYMTSIGITKSQQKRIRQNLR